MASLVRAAPAGPSTRVIPARQVAVGAITQKKKEEIVGKVSEQLDGASLALGMRFKGLTVSELSVSFSYYYHFIRVASSSDPRTARTRRASVAGGP